MAFVLSSRLAQIGDSGGVVFFFFFAGIYFTGELYTQVSSTEVPLRVYRKGYRTGNTTEKFDGRKALLKTTWNGEKKKRGNLRGRNFQSQFGIQDIRLLEKNTLERDYSGPTNSFPHECQLKIFELNRKLIYNQEICTSKKSWECQMKITIKLETKRDPFHDF
jgi:hypothetical protein